MAAPTTTPAYAQVPIIGIATLTSPSAITSRANITGTTGLVQLTATSTNGTPVSSIVIKSKETSVALCVGVWMYNGTTSFLFDEILVTAITGSTTVASERVVRTYEDLVVPPTYQLFISSTVDNDLTAFAMGGTY